MSALDKPVLVHNVEEGARFACEVRPSDVLAALTDEQREELRRRLHVDDEEFLTRWTARDVIDEICRT